MSRLTDRDSYCLMHCADDYIKVDGIGESCKLYKSCFERKMYDKLKRYEDLEEAGLLIYPRPELEDCEKCGAVENFGDCFFFGYRKNTYGFCKKSMAELKEGGCDE